jgi:predicted acetyltransferase
MDRAHSEQRDSGPVVYDVATVRSFVGRPGLYSYGTPDGFLSFFWADRQNIVVQRLVACSEESARTLWSILASHATAAHTVRVPLSPRDPLPFLLPEEDIHVVSTHGWCLRVLDVPSALEARAYPPGTNETVLLHVADPSLPANTGCWELAVADGCAKTTRLEDSPPEAVRLEVGGLAALYAGAPIWSLVRAGLAQGGTPRDRELMDAIFRAEPYSLDIV